MFNRLLFTCHDDALKMLQIDMMRDPRNNKLFKTGIKSKGQDSVWKSLELSEDVREKGDYLEISLKYSYADFIRLATNSAGTSSIRIKGKIVPLSKYVQSNVADEKHEPPVVISQNLTKDSPFDKVAQYLADKYYLQPYRDENINAKIKRHYHGATHAACATYTVDNADVIKGNLTHVDVKNKQYNGGFFIEILKKYLPNDYWKIISELNDNKDLTEEDFLLLKYAVFCHDIANTSEYFRDEAAHAKIFQREMIALGFHPDQVKRFADAIANKEVKGKRNILQMLIHDADNIEFNRVIPDPAMFDIQHLDLVTVLKQKLSGDALKSALAEVNNVAIQHFKMNHYIYDNASIHEHCELGGACYQHVQEAIDRCNSICQGLRKPNTSTFFKPADSSKHLTNLTLSDAKFKMK